MFRGRFQLGEEVHLAVLCRDASLTPFAPTEAPTADVWSASAKVRTLALPALDRPAVTGLFAQRLFLGAGFAAGLYRVEYRFRSGSFSGLEEDQFEIVAGGHADGAVTALAEYRRPHALYVVQSLDSGKILRGKNPRV